MCVLVINNEKDGKPLRSNYGIAVLGNFYNILYQKSQRYAAVLKYSSLRLITSQDIRDKHILQQGDCKNTLCNSTLPDSKVTVICPPHW